MAGKGTKQAGAGRTSLWLAIVGALAAAAPYASSQDAAKPDQAPQVKDMSGMVVTGISASAQRAVAIKKASDQIVDTVSAVEIGQLPDFNAGDALKRVTGVNALLYQGEPRFIIVRGFNQNYNDILIDGFSLASTDINLGQTNTGGRQVSMEVLPSNLASHIDVIKSAIPAVDGNFIGGLTNFVTPSAFDYKNNTVSASLLGGASLDKGRNGGDHPTGQAQVSGAKQWGAQNQFGLYLSATYWSRDINVPQVETGGTRNWYTASGAPTVPYGGTGYAVPSQRLYYNYQNKRDRSGLQGRFDWIINDRFSAFVNAYYFRQNENSDRNDLNASVQPSSSDLRQTPTTGTLTNVTQTIQLGRYRWRRDLGGLYGRFTGELANGWTIDGGSSWSASKVDNPQTIDNFSQSKLAFNYDTGSTIPRFTAVNPAAADALALYALGFHREERYRLNENRFDEQLNASFNAQPADRGAGVAFGARATGIYQNVSFSRVSWSGAPYTLADAASGQLCGYLCDTPIPTISAALAERLFQTYRASEVPVVDVASDAGGTYRTHEVVLAGYGQAQYRSDNWYVVGGVRVESTQAGSDSTQAVNGVYAPVSASNHYTNFLPSVSAVIDTSDASKLRLGASETVSRPTFGASSLHGGVLNTLTSPATLAVGNPELKPRRAENFDIGHDWYIDDQHGIVSIAGFYKRIHDDIFSYGVLQNLPGISEPVLVTQARNTANLVTDWGVELGFSRDLAFLPAPFDGLGVSANATLSRARFPITLSDGSVRTFDNLPDQPGKIYNASIYYDKGPLHGRIAWNHLGELWDDRYPNFTPSGFYANRFQQATDNVDLQVSYDVDKHLSLSLNALNLTKQNLVYDYGRNQELLQSKIGLPRIVMVGITFKN